METNQISIEKANKIAEKTLYFAWLSIVLLLWGWVSYFFPTPVLYGITQYFIINHFANRALNENTSIPETAKKAKKIAKILLIAGVCISLIIIFDAYMTYGSFMCSYLSC
jgi:hypothetical protein